MAIVSDTTLGAMVLILGILCPIGSIVARWVRAPVQPGADSAKEISVATPPIGAQGPSNEELRSALERLIILDMSPEVDFRSYEEVASSVFGTVPLSDQVLSRMSERAQVLAARDKAAREAAARRAIGGTPVSDAPVTPGLRPFRRPPRKLVLDCPDFSVKDEK
jgi:hypothetical protein